MARAKKRADGRITKTFTFNGKRYYVYGRTASEAAEAERLKRDELAKGYEKRKDPTIKEYFEIWTQTRKGSVKANTNYTLSCFFNLASKIEIPGSGRKFGELRLSEITAEDIREIQRKVSEDHTTNGTNQTINLISHVMKTAVKERYIDFNPCELVSRLKRTEEEARDTIHRALTKEETAAFFEAAKDSFYYQLFRFAICTGARIGEIGALFDTDIVNGLIHIERTITRTEGGAFILGESAKTAKGRRTIPVNDTITAIINAQKERNRYYFGISLHDRIFKNTEGGLINATAANYEIRKICKAAGIEYFSFHAFRDTFATRALEQGMNPKTLQELLGHSDFSMTMNLYGHVLDETKRDAMQKLVIAV